MHRIESREPYKSGYGGMPLFIYLVYTVWVSDRSYCTGGKQSTDSPGGLASTIAIAIT